MKNLKSINLDFPENVFKPTFNVAIIIFYLLILTSCEFNLTKENFVDIEEPTDLEYFDLNLIPEGDTLEIYGKTSMSFSFNSDGHELLGSVVSFQGKSWELFSNQNIITIDPSEFTIGIDTLSLKIYFKIGNGSIGDQLGMQGYMLEKKWLVILDGRPAPVLSVTKRINDDGFLVIEWPKCDQYNFESYDIECNSSSRSVNKQITNPNQNYFIDSLYVGGNFNIRVSCRLKNDHAWGKSLDFQEEPPQMQVEELGLDSIRISWNKSNYNAKYRLEIDYLNILYFNNRSDTSCIVKQPGLGKNRRLALCTSSAALQNWPDVSSYCDITSYKDYSLGQNIINANFPEFGYNMLEKTIYSNQYDQLRGMNINNYSVINTSEIPMLMYEGEYSCPTNSTKVAALAKDNIFIFDNKNLQSPLVIPDTRMGAFSNDHFILTDNNYIAYATNNTYKLIDVALKQVVTTVDIADYPVFSKWACITTSQDAKYMCTVTKNGIRIFQLEPGKATEIYTDTRVYRSAYFNPQQPDELFLTFYEDRGIEIRNPKDFSLKQKIDIPEEMVIRNIDPETGNLLVTDYINAVIIDIKTHKILLNVPCSEAKCWLYNNHLFTNTGYVLDLSELI